MTTAPSPAARVRFHSIVWPLAIAETIVWAAMYYSFPALLPAWERDLGWSKTELSFAFTLSLVVSASLVPVAGRLIDRGFARAIFTGGTVLGAVLLALLSAVTEPWQFFCVWIGLGRRDVEHPLRSLLRGAGAFDRRSGAAGDHHRLDRRGTRGHGGVSERAPACGSVRLAGRGPGVRRGGGSGRGAAGMERVPAGGNAGRGARAGPEPKRGPALAVASTPAFWLLAIAIFLAALDHGMLISHVLPILDDRGIDPGLAVVAASLVGPMQVAGRLALMAAERFATTLVASTGCFAMMALAGMCLLEADAAPALLVGFVVLQGAGIGVASVMRPMVTAELLGRKNFGVVSGLVGLMHMSGYAVGPSVSAMVWAWGGYDRVIVVAILAAVTAIAALLAAWRANGRGPPEDPG